MSSSSNIRLQAQAFIEKAVRQGISANKTLDILRSMGLGYRRQVFLEDYRRVADRPKKEDVAKYTPTKYVPPEGAIEKVPYILSTPYVYHFRVTYRDTDTGEVINQRYSIGVRDKVSIGQARDTLMNALVDRQDVYGKEVKSIVFEYAWERE